jgi:hypothetical protein
VGESRLEKGKKAMQVLFWAVALAFNCFLIKGTQAAEVHFGQSILPVRFVYLDHNGQITKIWSNVSEKDSVYIIKYFDEKSQKEVALESNNVFNSYQNIIDQTQLISGSVSAADMKGDTVQDNLAIDFVKINNTVEEIHTYS